MLNLTKLNILKLFELPNQRIKFPDLATFGEKLNFKYIKIAKSRNSCPNFTILTFLEFKKPKK